MDDVALILEAASFAAQKHRGQRRKDSDVPYVNHPLAVARILAAEGGVRDVTTLCAALLHDTIEDTDTTAAEIERAFGGAVAGVVREVSDDGRLPKVERKRQQVLHAPALSTPARLVKLADKLDNLRDLAARPPRSWDGDRVRGYFCWARAVVDAVGPANAPLFDALQALFAAELTVGSERVRAVPADPVERARVLAGYYARMAALS